MDILYNIDSARAEIIQYLETIQQEIVDQIISKKMNASGRTIESLQVIPSNTGAKLVAAPHIIFLEDGRGPTSPTGPYQQSNESLLEIITKWIDDKGLDLNPYAVTKTIHAKGTKLYRQGGKSGVLSVPLQAAGLNDVYRSISTKWRQQVSSEIYEPINELQNA